MDAIAQKNVGYLKQLLTKEQYNGIKVFVNKYDSIDDCLNQLQQVAKSDATINILKEFTCVCAKLIGLGYENNIQIASILVLSNQDLDAKVYFDYILDIGNNWALI
jgi:hypothetical protein